MFGYAAAPLLGTMHHAWHNIQAPKKSLFLHQQPSWRLSLVLLPTRGNCVAVWLPASSASSPHDCDDCLLGRILFYNELFVPIMRPTLAQMQPCS